jgi:hypothetical protein
MPPPAAAAASSLPWYAAGAQYGGGGGSGGGFGSAAAAALAAAGVSGANSSGGGGELGSVRNPLVVTHAEPSLMSQVGCSVQHSLRVLFCACVGISVQMCPVRLVLSVHLRPSGVGVV